MLHWSYQLYDINQRGEVRAGLVLLNDRGTQCFTCTLYEHLEKERTNWILDCVSQLFPLIPPLLLHLILLTFLGDEFFLIQIRDVVQIIKTLEANL